MICEIRGGQLIKFISEMLEQYEASKMFRDIHNSLTVRICTYLILSAITASLYMPTSRFILPLGWDTYVHMSISKEIKLYFRYPFFYPFSTGIPLEKPPLFYYYVELLRRIFFNDIMATYRYLPVVSSIILVISFFNLSSRLFQVKYAFLAALACAVLRPSPFHSGFIYPFPQTLAIAFMANAMTYMLDKPSRRSLLYTFLFSAMVSVTHIITAVAFAWALFFSLVANLIVNRKLRFQELVGLSALMVSGALWFSRLLVCYGLPSNTPLNPAYRVELHSFLQQYTNFENMVSLYLFSPVGLAASVYHVYRRKVNVLSTMSLSSLFLVKSYLLGLYIANNRFILYFSLSTVLMTIGLIHDTPWPSRLKLSALSLLVLYMSIVFTQTTIREKPAIPFSHYEAYKWLGEAFSPDTVVLADPISAVPLTAISGLKPVCVSPQHSGLYGGNMEPVIHTIEMLTTDNLTFFMELAKKYNVSVVLVNNWTEYYVSVNWWGRGNNFLKQYYISPRGTEKFSNQSYFQPVYLKDEVEIYKITGCYP